MLCKIRWIERYSAVLTFFNSYRSLIETVPTLLRGKAATLPLKHSSYKFQYVKWENVPLKDCSANLLDALALCSEDNYLNVSVLLQIFTTLSIPSARAERSFSALKYQKNVFWTAMNLTALH
ncbi:hypothetical protein T4B_2439 [Trichinella pseudospiralis]|uniref:HAT C-terminal dimerisation domain-containing protein n=1 Tax=Trichinella pseudospiralis TaxID=6337 RepID=A0A0V1HF55_TRIPS|nr:hypothetical protein T4B_2439 [Trichinella pseudospiralis]